MTELENMERRLRAVERIVRSVAYGKRGSDAHYDATEELLSDLGINNYRLRNGLVDLDVWTERDIQRLSFASLKRIRGVGKATIEKLLLAVTPSEEISSD